MWAVLSSMCLRFTMIGIIKSAVLLVLLTLYHKADCITSPYGWKNRISLSGLWKFKLSPQNDSDVGFREKWFSKPFEEEFLYMPVPCSYNDITSNRTIRDYLGWAWYQTDDVIDLEDWKGSRKMIHFGGVHYYTIVWFGETQLGVHEGGHIPFEFEINGTKGRITVAVNNTLNNYTIPQGSLTFSPGNIRSYAHNFDYFDYAGINRNVFLYRTPKDIFIEDVIIKTSFIGQTGYVKFSVLTNSAAQSPNCLVTLYDSSSSFNISKCYGVIKVPNPVLWWDLSSSHKPTAHLYTLKVVIDPDDYYAKDENIYELKVGIRTIDWNSDGLFLNGEKLYLKGFGKHEDADLYGRGFDWALTLKDMDLLKWTGSNSMRTTHYPHSLEWIDLADRTGLLVILESPACSLSHFDENLLALHKKIMLEIYSSYGNHPSIIMWSLANEPLSNQPTAEKYFVELYTSLRSIDTTRPITMISSLHANDDKGVEKMDVICFNRYNSWYTNTGDLSTIYGGIIGEVTEWRERYNRPVIITEYGAGSLSGLHMIPSGVWSEEYHVDLLHNHFCAFDKLRANNSLSGEMMWVFADFAVPQEYFRPGGCKKGAFTRNRQPKKAAYTIKMRYDTLDKKTKPDYCDKDLSQYFL